jgi:hypothetical protein
MKFILKYTGAGKPDLKKITAVLSVHDIQIVDDSLLPKWALIQGDESQVSQLKTALDGDWVLTPEKTFKVPDTKKRIRKS